MRCAVNQLTRRALQRTPLQPLSLQQHAQAACSHGLGVVRQGRQALCPRRLQRCTGPLLARSPAVHMAVYGRTTYHAASRPLLPSCRPPTRSLAAQAARSSAPQAARCPVYCRSHFKLCRLLQRTPCVTSSSRRRAFSRRRAVAPVGRGPPGRLRVRAQP